MSIFDAGPCSPWATTDDLQTVGCTGPYNDDMDVWLQAATDMLFPRTGRQWPGECEVTIRPCGTGHQACSIFEPVFNAARFEWWWNGWACGRNDCDCAGGPGAFRLPGTQPVSAIGEVIVDGVVLDPGEYRLDDARVLRRLGGSWPRCQDLDAPTTEPGTWAVTYTLGVPPPAAARLAAAAWACHLADVGKDCGIPAGATSASRQSVDVVLASASEVLDAGRTGIDLVDQLIDSVNPRGVSARARFRNPDDPRYVVT